MLNNSRNKTLILQEDFCGLTQPTIKMCLKLQMPSVEQNNMLQYLFSNCAFKINTFSISFLFAKVTKKIYQKLLFEKNYYVSMIDGHFCKEKNITFIDERKRLIIDDINNGYFSLENVLFNYFLSC